MRKTPVYANPNSLSKTIENFICAIAIFWQKPLKALGPNALTLVNKLVENVDNFPA